jgi:ABC-2 type transport system permease protein
VIVSSKVSDVRTASQLGGLMFMPFIGIYVASEIGVLVLNTTNLLYIAGIMAVLVVVCFRISTATFRREEILTKWK